MYNKNMNKYWIWFSRINKIGAKTQNELLKTYKTPEKIWNLKRHLFRGVFNFNKHQQNPF